MSDNNELLKLDLEKFMVLKNFLLEALEARKEPVDLRLIMFEDEEFSHEELVATVENLAHHAVKDEPVYMKDALQALVEHLDEEITELKAQLSV